MLITILVRRPVLGISADAWNIRRCVEHRGAHQGAFTHRADFQKLACAKRGLARTGQHLGARAWCARRVNYSQASSEPTAAPATKATHQPHHQRHTSRINSTSTRSHTPTTSPAPENHAPIKPAAPATPHINPQQPQHQRQKPHTNHITSRLHQRFLYCDGETPNISLKYFAKYFCVPKPTASETSTTLSPASADNSWAALLSRMVRMNTEGFIP